MAEEERSIFEDAGSDPRLMPGTLVNQQDNEYSKKSYQGLIMARMKTDVSVIYDIVRSADLSDRQRDAVDGALMLGAWEFNAPAMNRQGIIAILEDEAEALADSLPEGKVDELDELVRQDVHDGVSRRLDDGLETEYYGYRRDSHRLRMEIAVEREEGHHIRDYTGVKDMLANGVPLAQVVDLLPVYFLKVLTICNVSLAKEGKNTERYHIESLVANEGPGSRMAYNGRKERGRVAKRSRPRADDEE